ncbi:MAG: corrinoid protein [Alphaproteobacteria bacterium]|jgi:5-methyltetrahydrofolate--homocysteine methyltransferase|nr:corrinoid protein [Alphaproteobacteria bacterium]
MAKIFKLIGEAVEQGDDKAVVQMVDQASKSGNSALEILQEALIPGIQAMGESFRDGTVYLPDVLVACRAMTRGVEFLQPQLTKTNIPKRGTVVIGTAEGDMHDIGKDLIKLMLECSGFEVEDLGTDVLPQDFVDGVRRSNANIVAVSALLTTTMYAVPEILKALSEAGLRDRVKVLVGGAPVTRSFAEEIGADGFGEDFVEAVDEADRLLAL